MSEHKGPRPCEWFAPLGDGHMRVGAYINDTPPLVTVDAGDASLEIEACEANALGLMLIMAAAVARGEQGHAAALNRVAVALGAQFDRLTSPSPGDLRVLCDEWADMAQRIAGMVEAQLGVPLPRSLPPAVRTVVAERDTARAALAAVRDVLGVVGNGSPVLAAESLREEADALRASVAELCEDLAGAEAARDEAVQEAARLRAELDEAREALAGKTQHDAAAEVVAPLRERLGVGGEVSPGFVVQQAVRLIPSVVQMGGSPTWCKCGGERSGAWCTNCANPTREPMTHTSLASIEEHGVVVGDRLECVVGKTPRDPLSGFAVEAIRMRAALALLGVLVRDAAGRRQSPAFDDLAWPLTVVEAPDAD